MVSSSLTPMSRVRRFDRPARTPLFHPDNFQSGKSAMGRRLHRAASFALQRQAKSLRDQALANHQLAGKDLAQAVLVRKAAMTRPEGNEARESQIALALALEIQAQDRIDEAHRLNQQAAALEARASDLHEAARELTKAG
jgi:hypothetical protein